MLGAGWPIAPSRRWLRRTRRTVSTRPGVETSKMLATKPKLLKQSTRSESVASVRISNPLSFPNYESQPLQRRSPISQMRNLLESRKRAQVDTNRQLPSDAIGTSWFEAKSVVYWSSLTKSCTKAALEIAHFSAGTLTSRTSFEGKVSLVIIEPFMPESDGAALDSRVNDLQKLLENGDGPKTAAGRSLFHREFEFS